MSSLHMTKKENTLLDVLKFTASLLVLASHCLPLVPNEAVNIYYGQWFFRFSVPLFLISSGYFFSSFDAGRKRKYIARILVLYFVSSLLYLPLYANNEIKEVIRYIIFGYHHLWYLSALLISLVILYIFEKVTLIQKIFKKVYPFLALGLILIGAYYDEYQHIFSGIKEAPPLKMFGACVRFFGGSRHALFFAFPMLLIGKYLREHISAMKLKKTTCVSLTVIFFAVSFVEFILLKHFIGKDIACDITLFNYLPAIGLFLLAYIWQPKALDRIQAKSMRKAADIIYISHIWVLEIVDRLFEATYLIRLLLVLGITLLITYLYIKISGLILSKR